LLGHYHSVFGANLQLKMIPYELQEQNRQKRKPIAAGSMSTSIPNAAIDSGLQVEDIKPLWLSFNPIVSRELPFAVTKFLVFDLAAGTISDLVNNSNMLGDGNKIQVGVGTLGLLLSAFSGALAGELSYTYILSWIPSVLCLTHT
jgi:hypothetical protein